mgnify:CR=1 FL=1
MKKFIRHSLSLLALLGLLSSLAACSSNPMQSSDAAATDLKSLARKQQEHDKLLKKHDELLKEWSELKPGLTRLLAIEQELNLLLGQLAQLSTSLEESAASTENHTSTPSVAHYTPTPSPQPVQEVLATAEIPEPVSTETSDDMAEQTEPVAPMDANFALQVASIPEYYRLPAIWGQLLDKNPQLLANMEPNYQKTNVRNTDYYRLKIGSFATRQDANRKCNDLKAAGMNCLVVDYTSSNFDQITN